MSLPIRVSGDVLVGQAKEDASVMKGTRRSASPALRNAGEA